MSSITITLKDRDMSIKAKDMRKDDKLPCVIYGEKKENEHVWIPYGDFLKLYRSAGRNNVIQLTTDKGTSDVMIYDLHIDPVSDRFLNVDFKRIDKNKPVVINVPLVEVGESYAVRTLGGVLVRGVSALEVKCLPVDLVSKIEVDISVLKEFGKIIHAGDLDLPEKLELLTPKQVMLFQVMQPRIVVEHAETEVAEAGEGEGDTGEKADDKAGAKPESSATTDDAKAKEDKK